MSTVEEVHGEKEFYDEGFRDGAVDALERAAKAVCPLCAKGVSLDALEVSPRLHGPNNCDADLIHDLIAEAKGEK